MLWLMLWLSAVPQTTGRYAWQIIHKKSVTICNIYVMVQVSSSKSSSIKSYSSGHCDSGRYTWMTSFDPTSTIRITFSIIEFWKDMCIQFSSCSSNHSIPCRTGPVRPFRTGIGATGAITITCTTTLEISKFSLRT